MYSFRNGLRLDRRNGYDWLTIPTSIANSIQIKQLFKDFSQIVITIRHNSDNLDRIVDLENYRSQLIDSSLTIKQWLDANPNTNFIGMKPGSVRRRQYPVRSYTASQAAFKINTTDHISDIDTPHTPDKKSLILRATDPNRVVNYTNMKKYIMPSVNGFVHNWDMIATGDKAGYYINNGAISRDISKCASVGLHSFESIGSITQGTINANRLKPLEAGKPLKDGFIIDLGYNIANHTPFISVGGYFIIPDGKITKIYGDKHLIFYWDKFNWIDRYFEMRKYIDVSTLPNFISNINPSAVNYENMNSDAVIKALFNLDQTFSILVYTQPDSGMKYTVRQLRKSGGPNVYLRGKGQEYPTGLMYIGNGRIGEYWVEQHPNITVLRTTDARQYNYEYRNTLTDDLDNFDDAGVGSVPKNPDYKGEANYVKIEKVRIFK